ncbi:MAG: amidohydrolase family protein [Bryobacteraceae bacterium]|jgi:predicted amidohydrolase YtcJ
MSMRALLFAACAVAFGQPADLVLRNGKIVTMNAAQPAAQAMAVRGDRIAALGGNTDAAKWIGPGTKVIDLHGMLAIPGFIEGHGHFTGIGEFRLGLDLREARTWDEIVAQVARAARQAKAGEWIGAGGNYLTVRAVKRQMDGALGSRGAWLVEPYADQPNSRGLNTEDPADIRQTAELAIQHGYQLCIHAIGDRANREVLDIYEQVFREHPEQKDLRWRVEHIAATDVVYTIVGGKIAFQR